MRTSRSTSHSSAQTRARFDDIAAAHLGEKLALVIFGRVVSAPVVQEKEFNGKLAITGLTAAEAAQVKAALAS